MGKAKLRNRIKFFMAALLTSVGILSSWALAQETLRDDALAISATERAKRRIYPGGRDEQNLVVRSALPQPERSPDATPRPDGNDEDESID